uniref:Uncharacterized protein n=1 Tax=Chromera velia CCMP2878 TaxID=1169474 RepID=A0A0G4GLJ5_9ALVE|eukprot:Cvel_22432.t1-p1 / transcript=Cvel_22432.t1 / gene=Cvel_22432 / organism=Chromera_velia_CCMP2878 / gene_product=hypothetical protein / transcript_product=hypothetical protein / location=Cvel_scaffold2203:18624-21241(-) / protein_length=168 / sequence_SO=supercontig / SO=protein_coding / is_pseudo=false
MRDAEGTEKDVEDQRKQLLEDFEMAAFDFGKNAQEEGSGEGWEASLPPLPPLQVPQRFANVALALAIQASETEIVLKKYKQMYEDMCERVRRIREDYIRWPKFCGAVKLNKELISSGNPEENGVHAVSGVLRIPPPGMDWAPTIKAVKVTLKLGGPQSGAASGLPRKV